MTEEAQPAPPIQPQRRRRDLGAILYWLIWSVALVAMARKTGSWPIAILGFLSIWIPLLLLQFRAWKRWLRPDSIPARWPDGYRLRERLEALDSALWLIGVAGIGASWVFDKSRHPHEYVALGVIFFGAFVWEAVLARYIADRKYIPPPLPPHDPSNVIKPKPLRSEHWGASVLSQKFLV